MYLDPTSPSPHLNFVYLSRTHRWLNMLMFDIVSWRCYISFGCQDCKGTFNPVLKGTNQPTNNTVKSAWIFDDQIPRNSASEKCGVRPAPEIFNHPLLMLAFSPSMEGSAMGNLTWSGGKHWGKQILVKEQHLTFFLNVSDPQWNLTTWVALKKRCSQLAETKKKISL